MTARYPTTNPRWIFAIVGGLIAIAAIIAVTTSADSQNDASPAAEIAAPDITGTALPPLQDPANDPAIGQPAPSFAGSSFDGEQVTVTPGQDGPMLLLFLAHWCPHCQREVPVVQDWLDAGGLPDDVDLYTIATSIDETRPNYPPNAWLDREGWTPTTVVDDDAGALASAYGLTGFPYWVIVDGDGTVAGRLTGVLTPAQLDQLVADLTRR